MKCDLILAALSNLQCEKTSEGTRILTHCMYPNFDQVAVYVQTHLDGFLVHDGGAGYDFAFDEGYHATAVKGLMRDYSGFYGADTDGHRIFARAISPEWLPSAVMSVANASAGSATALVNGAADDRAEDKEFRERAFLVLCDAFKSEHVPRRIKRRGRTGKLYTFAFGVTYKNSIALVDTVTPNALSVASRFTSFSAVGGRKDFGTFLAYKRALSNEDAALLAEVADIVPLESLVGSIEREFRVRTTVQ